ncbi:hypothetical protein Q2T40_06885 [Winogradskyella maritima]|uniref:Lipocalin-like domain-containing protein n=1 Tax=Winogradskyella maritima TaxID=1517766 RepID=A0ABV8AND3_9FLAO|nr:hypothetical protein [Winogradskyella maritima]
MKFQIKNYLLVAFFALMTLFSCQNEETEIINPSETETIEANSMLANVMRSTSANSVRRDNVLDNSSCFSVDLPVTVVVSDITITITTEEDLEDLEDLLEDLEVDLPEFVFPITIIYSDYTELVIENQDQFEALLEQCFDDDDTIECVDFIYPISFSVFNSQFVLVDTITIEDDEALYDFLDRLEDESETLIVSLNFPVSLEYANGETTTVNTNAELADAIAMAGDDCEDDDYITCSVDDIKSFLKECSWTIDHDVEVLDDLEITFNDDFTFVIMGENLNEEVTGNWTVEETDNGTYLILSDLSAFQDDLGGEYLITECDDDDFELIKGDIEVDLDRNCESDINCSASDITQRLRTCYWYATSNLLPGDASNKLKFTENNTVFYFNNDTDMFVEIGEWAVVIVGMERKLELNLIAPYQALTGFWTVTECDDDYFSLANGDNVLMLEQECFDANPFECYNEEGYELVKCDENNTGTAQFNIYEAVPDCNVGFTVMITFHTSLSGAENDSDILEGATAYTNLSNPQTVYVKVQKVNHPDINIIYPVELVVEQCNTQNPFECFDGTVLEACDDTDGVFDNDLAKFDLTSIIEQADCDAEFNWSFHVSVADAETNVNPIAEPATYVSANGFVILRIENANGEYMLYDIGLTVVGCSDSGCSFEDFNANIVTCEWTISEYNGSTSFDIFNINFMADGSLTIMSETETYTGNWTSALDGYIYLEMTDISGGNVQVFNGINYKLVECTSEQLIFHNGDDQLTLDKVCN